jgi:hypothetical protein
MGGARGGVAIDGTTILLMLLHLLHLLMMLMHLLIILLLLMLIHILLLTLLLLLNGGDIICEVVPRTGNCRHAFWVGRGPPQEQPSRHVGCCWGEACWAAAVAG